jgi:hypothetical protein
MVAEEPSLIRQPVSKKLIQFGWHMPTAEFFTKNIHVMDKRPFDGVAIRISDENGGGNIFEVKKWSKTKVESRQAELKIFESLPKSSSFTNNFVVMYGASSMDWFSDEDWSKVVDNIRFCVQAAKKSGCRGVIWDGEPYGGINPWKYEAQQSHKTKSFRDYWQQVRNRGVDFIKVIQEEFPGLTVFSLRQFSDMQDGSPFSMRLLPVRDAKKVEKELSYAFWGLHVPFTVGIIEGIKPDTRFIDGNEDAYYYTSKNDFTKFFHAMKEQSLAFVPKGCVNIFWQKY